MRTQQHSAPHPMWQSITHCTCCAHGCSSIARADTARATLGRQGCQAQGRSSLQPGASLSLHSPKDVRQQQLQQEAASQQAQPSPAQAPGALLTLASHSCHTGKVERRAWKLHQEVAAYGCKAQTQLTVLLLAGRPAAPGGSSGQQIQRLLQGSQCTARHAAALQQQSMAGGPLQQANLQQHAELSTLCPSVPLLRSWVGQLCHLFLHAEMTTENRSPAWGPAPPTLTSCFSHKGIAEATCKQEHSSSGDHTCASSEQGSIPEHKQAACWPSQTSLGDGAAKSLQLFTSKFLSRTACSSVPCNHSSSC